MNIVFQVNFTGAPDADDVLAAQQQVALANQILANQIPPGTSLSTATPADVKASYLSLILTVVTAQHTSNIQAAKVFGFKQRFSQTEVQQIHVNLMTRLNGGESKASIIADTGS